MPRSNVSAPAAHEIHNVRSAELLQQPSASFKPVVTTRGDLRSIGSYQQRLRQASNLCELRCARATEFGDGDDLSRCTGVRRGTCCAGSGKLTSLQLMLYTCKITGRIEV